MKTHTFASETTFEVRIRYSSIAPQPLEKSGKTLHSGIRNGFTEEISANKGQPFLCRIGIDVKAWSDLQRSKISSADSIACWLAVYQESVTMLLSTPRSRGFVSSVCGRLLAGDAVGLCVVVCPVKIGFP